MRRNGFGKERPFVMAKVEQPHSTQGDADGKAQSAGPTETHFGAGSAHIDHSAVGKIAQRSAQSEFCFRFAREDVNGQPRKFAHPIGEGTAVRCRTDGLRRIGIDDVGALSSAFCRKGAYGLRRTFEGLGLERCGKRRPFAETGRGKFLN